MKQEKQSLPTKIICIKKPGLEIDNIFIEIRNKIIWYGRSMPKIYKNQMYINITLLN